MHELGHKCQFLFETLYKLRLCLIFHELFTKKPSVAQSFEYS